VKPARAVLYLLVAGLIVGLTQPAYATDAIRYTLSLAQPGTHLVHVTVQIPSGSDRHDLQLPVWNALYQVRDFSQYVNWIRAKDAAGKPLKVHEIDKSRWRIEGTGSGASVDYEIFTDRPGPYDAEFNPHHAFFNLAEVLMYPVEARSSAMQVNFVDVPAKWKFATALANCSSNDPTCFAAENYDHLVDSPVEIGTFRESDFDEGGGHYRVVVDADPSDYDMQKIVPMVRKIVDAETSWMDDRPFDAYTFLYHFPRAPVYGGMEHAYSTAITLGAQVLRDDPQQLTDVTAHEFFHLWNVKRIRPQSLQPVDYAKENYTDALWFSEGVTNTVEDYVLLRAGLLDEGGFLQRLGNSITALERRPAHLTQSAEESSLDAWLEKYAYYRLPQRSISYYNKGELLGVLLDLQMREASGGRATLRELFQWMNKHYAKEGKFFDDTKGVEQSAEEVCGCQLSSFFVKYAAGSEEVPWNDFFRTVGLRIVENSRPVADLGFVAERSFDAPPEVVLVNPKSAAEASGLAVGDLILAVNGQPPEPNIGRQLAQFHPGDSLQLKVRGEAGERTVQWKLGSRSEVEFHLRDVENITPQQKARRAAWLKGESQQEGAHR
jgi:predicted metalloprotease with PDZ domain